MRHDQEASVNAVQISKSMGYGETKICIRTSARRLHKRIIGRIRRTEELACRSTLAFRLQVEGDYARQQGLFILGMLICPGLELIISSSGNSGCYTYQTVASYLIISFPDSDQGGSPTFLLEGPTGDSVQFGWVLRCNSAPPLTPNGLNTSLIVAPKVLV